MKTKHNYVLSFDDVDFLGHLCGEVWLVNFSLGLLRGSLSFFSSHFFLSLVLIVMMTEICHDLVFGLWCIT